LVRVKPTLKLVKIDKQGSFITGVLSAALAAELTVYSQSFSRVITRWHHSYKFSSGLRLR